MKKLISPLLALFLMAAATLANASPQVTAETATAKPAKPDFAHVAAVAEMLIAAGVPEAAKLAFRGTPGADATGLSNEEVARALAPAYAPHISPAIARELMAAFHTPPGEKVRALELARLRSPAAMPKLSANERAGIREFTSRPAYIAFRAAQDLAAADTASAMAALGGRANLALLMKGLQAVAAKVKAHVESASGAEPVLFLPEKSGVAYVDKLVALVATTAWRNTHGAWRIDKELSDLGIETVVAPANLVTPEGVARSKRILSQVDDKVDTLMRESDQTMKAFLASFKQIDMPGKKEMLVGFKNGLEKHMEWSVRFVENQRAMVDVMRRVVAFADSRMGKITLSGGELMLMDDDDVVLYNKLADEMQRELARFETVRGEAVGRVTDVAAGKFPKAK